MTGYEVIDNYILDVRSGAYPVCREQLALCDFIEHVFATEDIRIDTEQLAKYFNFQRFFPFDLLPWEKFVFALHNCFCLQKKISFTLSFSFNSFINFILFPPKKIYLLS